MIMKLYHLAWPVLTLHCAHLEECESWILICVKGLFSLRKNIFFLWSGWLNYLGHCKSIIIRIRLSLQEAANHCPRGPQTDNAYSNQHFLPGFNKKPPFSSLICLVSNCYLGNEAWALPGLALSWYNCVMEPLRCIQDRKRMKAFAMPAQPRLSKKKPMVLKTQTDAWLHWWGLKSELYV